MKNFFGLLGRVCISVIFIISAFEKIWNWSGTEAGLVACFESWMQHSGTIPWIEGLLKKAVEYRSFVLGLGVAFECVGGALVLLGFQVRLGAALLAIFLLISTVCFHSFWMVQGSERDLQQIMFLKNLAIFGGILLLLAFGKEDKKTGKKRASS